MSLTDSVCDAQSLTVIPAFIDKHYCSLHNWDAPVMEFLRESLPAHTKAIVTTRHRIDVAYPIRLSGMPLNDAEKLIDQECRKKNVVLNDEQKGKLYKRTGGVPLAIVWTVARIGFGYNTRNVLASLGNPKGDIAHFCFREVVDSIKQRDSYKLLLALAACKGKAVRDQLMYVACLEQDELSCEDGLVELELLSLINKQGDSFTMLPLTKEYINHELVEAYSFREEAARRLTYYTARSLLSNFSKPMQKYIQRFRDRHNTIKILGMRRPVQLDEIYTDVQLLPQVAPHYYESVESLEQSLRESGKRSLNFHSSEGRQGIEVANEQQYLMVLGGPGVGKSTFLQKVGLEALRRYISVSNDSDSLDSSAEPECCYAYSQGCFPVMLRLRHVNSDNLKLEDHIARELEICGFQKAKELAEQLLRSGVLLLLLDGLDEVPLPKRNQVVNEIEDLVNRFDKNRFAVSCRSAAYNFSLERFTDVVVTASEDAQIKRFIKKWFQHSSDTETEAADRLWQLLNSKEYKAIKELAQSPLLLMMFCYIYEQYGDLPRRRVPIINQALSVLLQEWLASKRILLELGSDLGYEIELKLLSEIAYNSFVDGKVFFTKQWILENIQNFLSRITNTLEIGAEKVLTAIEVQQGIIVEHSRNAYSFSHLVIQEYLTAEHIVSTQQTENLIKNHLTDKRWREIFLLAAGLSSRGTGVDSFLLLIESEIRKVLSSRNITQILSWIESVTNYAGDATLSEKRLTILSLVVAIGVSPEYAKVLIQSFTSSFGKNSELLKAVEFSMPSILGVVQILEDRCLLRNINFLDLKNCAEQIDSERLTDRGLPEKKLDAGVEIAFTQALRLPLRHIHLSEEEQIALKTYVETYELMVRCEEEAIVGTQQVLNEIGSRFLTPL